MKKKEREILKEKLNCLFIKINQEGEDFNIFKAIKKIHRDINNLTKEMTKKETKNSITDDVNRLSKAGSEFSNNSTISKFTKNFARHILPTL